MNKKSKKRASNSLKIQMSGLALSTPIVLLLGGVLLVLNIVVGTVTLGALTNIGGMQALLLPTLPFLLITLLLGLTGMIGLVYGLVRYADGIHMLSRRLRGIQNEQSRVERLMDKQIRADHIQVIDDNDDARYQSKG